MDLRAVGELGAPAVVARAHRLARRMEQPWVGTAPGGALADAICQRMSLSQRHTNCTPPSGFVKRKLSSREQGKTSQVT